MRRTLPLAALLALAAPAAAAPAQTARPTLVPQASMAGVKLGMSKDRVRALLGRPAESVSRTDDFGRATTWYFSGPKVHVTFRAGVRRPEVSSLVTRRGVTRPAEGVGVGSTEAAVRAKVDGVRCETFRLPGRDARSCHVGSFDPGTTVTDLRLDARRRVASILLGIVID
jgi:hypothetical protein